ncbi:hypothetical protein D3C71_1958180 [compost metagenome]
MEPEIYQAFGNILHTNAAAFFDWTDIKNAFVRNEAIFTGIKHWIMLFQTASDVIRT